MTSELSQLDRRLLERVQRSFPLVRRPFGQLAAELAIGEGALLRRVGELAAPGGIVREIAGVFDATSLGFASTLVAAECPAEGLDRAGAVAAEHPGVSHCYARGGELNLWFTLVLPSGSRLGLGGTVALLGRRMGARRILSLPAARRYKLDVRFGLGDQSPDEGADPHLPSASPDLLGAGDSSAARLASAPSSAQVRAICALQRSLPVLEEPFDALAAPEGLSGDDLLVAGADFLARGWMRRYAAVLRHRLAGLTVNVLVAWDVPPGRADVFAAHAARLAAVSHCYLRRAGQDWPYTLYTMLHGRSEADVGVALDRLALAGQFPHVRLPTLKEYKKQKVHLFSPAFAEWERAASPSERGPAQGPP